MMKFLIEIEGESQPRLIESLDAAREQLVKGHCFLNCGGSIHTKLCPADQPSEDEFRRLAELARPRLQVEWTR